MTKLLSAAFKKASSLSEDLQDQLAQELQSLKPEKFARLVGEVRKIAETMGKTI